MSFVPQLWLALLLGLLAFALLWRGLRGVGSVLLAAGFGACWPVRTLEVDVSTIPWPLLLLGVATLGGCVMTGLLLMARVWSMPLAWSLTGLGSFSLGWWQGRVTSVALTEHGESLLLIRFEQPAWLGLLLFVPWVAWLSRRTLSGLGPSRKWSAVTLRSLGLCCVALALAEPRFRQPTIHSTVLFVVDRSFSVPREIADNQNLVDATDRRWERVRNFIEQATARRPEARMEDKVGLVLFGKRPKLALPPDLVRRMPVEERMAGPIDGNYTDIAAALKLSLASFPEGTAKRIVLISDGNENIGRAEAQAELARKNGVQIDTIALAPGFRNENEILIQSIESPSAAALGQRLPVRVLIRNTSPDRVVDGRLEVVKSATGETVPIELEPNDQVLELGQPPKVRLFPGLNVFRFRDKVDPQGDKSFTFRATFAPLESRPVAGGLARSGVPGDRIENNRVETAVVVRGQRRILLLDENAPGTNETSHRHLLNTLRFEATKGGGGLTAKLRVDRLPAEKLPTNVGELGVFLANYDAVILANVPYERFTAQQAELLRKNVYDLGCGLVMIGGPDSFGAGGYQGTPIEAALPVDCEIKALKAAGRGGLVLIMHASEMADGNKWQKDIAKLAIQRLGPADMVGVVQYGFGGPAGVNWHIPFQSVGEQDSNTRRRILAQVDSLVPGDMPDFDPFLVAAYDTLSDPKHNLTVKHTIIISDGDPNYSGPGITAVQNMAAAGITCTTVGVATHGGTEKSRMKQIAEGTKDGNGKPGSFYDVTNPNQLPQIYIKESRRISQSFVTKDPFVPKVTGLGGIGEVLPPNLPNPLPSLYGMVRTTLKSNILASMALEGPSPYPDQQFPLLASWRYGLGKAVAFTSDARTQPGEETQFWDKDWVSSEVYRKFWEQLMNWVMREPERGKLTLTTEYREGRVRVVADVRDEQDRPVSGVNLRGAVATPRELAPGETAPTIEFKSKGGGLFEAEFPAEEAGSYFLNVQAVEPEKNAAGQIQLNPDGSARMKPIDSALAGLTVPYSPEFSDLESNSALLRRIAETTGGQYFEENEATFAKLIQEGTLFREPLEGVRAVLPFWYWLVFVAAFALLGDVALRRVALDVAGIRQQGDQLWQRLRGQLSTPTTEGYMDRLSQRKSATAAAIDRERASRRFELPTDAPRQAAPAGADDYTASALGSASSAPETSSPSSDPPPAAPAAEETDTLAKLRKARDRSRHRQPRPEDQ